jgi:hypothetical protein
MVQTNLELMIFLLHPPKCWVAEQYHSKPLMLLVTFPGTEMVHSDDVITLLPYLSH